MKLKVQQGTGGTTNNVHKELVSAVGWNAFNELYSCSDDKTVCRWDMHGDASGKVSVAHGRPRSHHTFSPFFSLFFSPTCKKTKQKKNR